MADLQVDLSNCDRELIHIPGKIQSHGFLIVIDKNGIISFLSENISDFLNCTATDFLGKSLQSLQLAVGNTADLDSMINLLTSKERKNSIPQINPHLINIRGIAYHLIISVSGEYLLLEFEPASLIVKLKPHKIGKREIAEIASYKDLYYIMNRSVKQVKDIIHFDRVMIYRFAEDGHGEVLCEAKNDGLEPWIGLHYPASDIPKQAREMYKINLVRQIVDVNSIPSKIVTNIADAEPLDLTNAQLRAVSPIHIQYLKNMGVASSFSISLIYNSELWGLIACHNYTPCFVDYTARESAKLTGQILSAVLDFKQNEQSLFVDDKFKNSLKELTLILLESSDMIKALTNNDVTLLDIADVSGVLLVCEGQITKLGILPHDSQIKQLLKWLSKSDLAVNFNTDHLSLHYPAALAYSDICSGMMVSFLNRKKREYIIWFKPGQLQTIHWAGNPDKYMEKGTDGLLHISPRNSFKTWSQTVNHKSEPWATGEINSIIRLKEAIAIMPNFL
ncbi:GAF domain-containing protein [Pedobacter sp. L105]|uniref:GAF domain-containing protein n=1 Tax=Pedobacter sp. L105 TaxID=1641871 RepID=UPI00131CED98|nr:GAF domain-containing protein [Pedobacter sp. L105]